MYYPVNLGKMLYFAMFTGYNEIIHIKIKEIKK